MDKAETFAVLGAGSWGTALAILLARNGHTTTLWSRDLGAVESMRASHCNTRYLPENPFPESLRLTADIAQALHQATTVLIAVPSGGFRQILQRLIPLLSADMRVCWATKGLEHSSQKLLQQVFVEELGASFAPTVISGPTFAREVASGLPTAVTIASTREEEALSLAEAFRNDTFRAYTATDVIGVQVGGALKNVLAIAAGVADGLGFGANARAALITRGLTEMSRLGIALGGKMETFMGLAGLGDLVLTCTDNQSRNRRFGLCLGQGMTQQAALASIDQVVEGIQTAQEMYALAARLQVEMPICSQVFEVLVHGKPPKEAVRSLLLREIKAES
jgi:glycerol-3-phosphate dehydrogenase (NAD(P)+)